MSEQDLNAVADIHVSAYGRDHFTSIMPVDLLRDYYASCTRLNPYSYIARDRGTEEIAGFVVGGFRTRESINLFVKQHYIRLGMTLLQHPCFLLEKVLSLLQRAQPASSHSCRLLSIAVAPAYQSTGVGAALLRHFEAGLRASHVFTYGLSVRVGNAGALRFYKRCNFEIECQTRGTVYLVKRSESEQQIKKDQLSRRP
jgi:ribosomal protein S18 acetylase RimI-like enzyme